MTSSKNSAYGLMAASKYLLALSVLVSVSATAQEHAGKSLQFTTSGDGEMFMFKELMAGVMQHEDGPQVEFAMPSEQRLEVYRKVDIKQNDIIMMVNGKRIRTVDNLRKAFESIKIGEDVKLGIKRGKDMTIVSFAKGDPDKFPKMKITTMSGPAGKGKDEGGAMTIVRGGPGAVEVAMLSGTGILVAKKQDALVIMAFMEDGKQALGDADIQVGDRIVSFQGGEVTETDKLSELFDEIKVGEEITLVLAREKKEFTVTFAKPEGGKQPGVMMVNPK